MFLSPDISRVYNRKGYGSSLGERRRRLCTMRRRDAERVPRSVPTRWRSEELNRLVGRGDRAKSGMPMPKEFPTL